MSDVRFPFSLGDRVEVESWPGRTGTVLLIEGHPDGDPSAARLWLEMHPGAMGGYYWIYGHFAHSSWAPDRDALHPLNIVPASECRKVEW